MSLSDFNPDLRIPLRIPNLSEGNICIQRNQPFNPIRGPFPWIEAAF